MEHNKISALYRAELAKRGIDPARWDHEGYTFAASYNGPENTPAVIHYINKNIDYYLRDTNKETRDQIASVMLQFGTKEQQIEALRYCRENGLDVPAPLHRYLPLASLSKWDQRFLDLAKFYSTWSKDPSTQVGAVITRGNVQVSQGYNGFPAGVGDSPERYADRELKISGIPHAEENALLFARQDLSGCTVYVWPMPPCGPCAAKLIQAGIKRVVAKAPTPEQAARWGRGMEVAATFFREAGVEVVLVQ